LKIKILSIQNYNYDKINFTNYKRKTIPKG